MYSELKFDMFSGMKTRIPLDRITAQTLELFQGNEDDIVHVLPDFSVFRQRQESEFGGLVYHPLFCVILRGRKEFKIGERCVSLSAGEAFVISHDMPIASKIKGASLKSPYIATIFSLDLGILRSLQAQVASVVEVDPEARFLSTGSYSSDWAEPLLRYMQLSADPLKAEVLGPLIQKEIHFQLLLSPMGGMLRNLLFIDSSASRVARAIQHIREKFREPLAIAELANVASMSTSLFYDRFKSVTGTTPLQYQKDLRLIEARQLLMGGGWSVSGAGLEVGYESPSHFSRDYTRRFQCSPRNHLARNREPVSTET
ncbi:MAG: AraC family transcriptional regulator [Pseudomonadota bacterium]